MPLRHLALILFLFLCTAAPAQAWTGTVVKVVDGDTLRVQDSAGKLHKVRIYGIDCPELAQEYGPEAQSLTAQIVMGKTVTVVPVAHDRYKRTVAGIVIVDDLLVLQEALTTHGLAWVDDRYCKIPACELWRIHQQDARQAESPRGLWQDDNAAPPWDWRRAKKQGKQFSVARPARKLLPSTSETPF